MKELGIVHSPRLNSGNNSSHSCHHCFANVYINIHQCSGVLGTGIVGQLVSVLDPETVSNRGQCKTKVCEFRYCKWAFIPPKNQSPCFPQLWYWDAFPSPLKMAVWGTALHLQQPQITAGADTHHSLLISSMNLSFPAICRWMGKVCWLECFFTVCYFFLGVPNLCCSEKRPKPVDSSAEDPCARLCNAVLVWEEKMMCAWKYCWVLLSEA